MVSQMLHRSSSPQDAQGEGTPCRISSPPMPRPPPGICRRRSPNSLAQTLVVQVEQWVAVLLEEAAAELKGVKTNHQDPNSSPKPPMVASSSDLIYKYSYNPQ